MRFVKPDVAFEFEFEPSVLLEVQEKGTTQWEKRVEKEEKGPCSPCGWINFYPI